jgi:hypothetical protein
MYRTVFISISSTSALIEHTSIICLRHVSAFLPSYGDHIHYWLTAHVFHWSVFTVGILRLLCLIHWSDVFAEVRDVHKNFRIR